MARVRVRAGVRVFFAETLLLLPFRQRQRRLAPGEGYLLACSAVPTPYPDPIATGALALQLQQRAREAPDGGLHRKEHGVRVIVAGGAAPTLRSPN